MRKFALMSFVMIAVLSIAAGGRFGTPMGAPMIPRQVPDFERIEFTGKVSGFGFYNGRLFVTVEATDAKYYVLIPVMAMRFENFEMKMGEEISVTGQKMVFNNRNVVFPMKITIDGKDLIPQMRSSSYYWMYPKWWIFQRRPLNFKDHSFMRNPGVWNEWWMMRNHRWMPKMPRLPMNPAPRPMPVPQPPMVPQY